MKRRILPILALAFCASALTNASAQDQQGTLLVNQSYPLNLYGFKILGNPTPACNSNSLKFSSVSPSAAWNNANSSGDQLADYFTLEGGAGSHTFQADISWGWAPFYSCYQPSFQLVVDGQVCTTCNVQTQTLSFTDCDFLTGSTEASGVVRVTVTHQAGDAWSDVNGARRFALRAVDPVGNTPTAELRFNAVMVGTSYSQVMGYFNAPSAPLYVLRDPPGDKSYGTISSSQNTCFGQTYSVTTEESANVWAKAKLGTSGSVGLIVMTDYEVYGEVGVDLTMGRSETSDREYQTCVESSSEFTTNQDGAPDDLFIGSAIRYAYGVGKIVERTSCTNITKDARFAMTPVNVISSYHYPESYIRSTVIPNMQTMIASLTPGNQDYKDAVNQLDVWFQTLAMNNAIKTSAPLEINRAFVGGPGESYALTTTTSESQNIEMNVSLDAGISIEFGAYFGGSGVAVGAEMRMRNEYGSGQNSSNESTNTMGYHLEDDDAGSGADDFVVAVRKDAVFGTYVFDLDSTVSSTSCPYEGGYRIDQPSLSVGTAGTSNLINNEVPLGTPAIFPIIVCNNSTQDRTYYLKFRSTTNTEGGVLNAFGSQVNGNDNGVQLDLEPGECLNTNLELSQFNAGVVDYEDIELYLYSLCESDIRSTITISAYFGAGNGDFGEYCTPSSGGDPQYFYWIDGVEVGTISNLNSGPIAPPESFEDLTATYSTNASIGQQQLITITPGGNVGSSRFAAWIDYNHDRLFTLDEKLGEFPVTGITPQSIAFTIPANALTGPTTLRVRSVYIFEGSEPDPVQACYAYTYSEIEDYGLVIDDNPPLDCAGVANGSAAPGTACDDGNADTGNDTYTANCECIGQPLDCTGTPNGTVLPGSACDDGDAGTGGDVYGNDCVCAGLPYDCLGILGGNSTPGTPCDDNSPETGNDTFDANCTCVGLFIDCAGVAGGQALPGTACDDGNPNSINDVYSNDCNCAGVLPDDCLGVPGGTTQPGTACDDNDPDTGNDIYNANCECAGEPFDCNGIAGGPALPGVACDDMNTQTINDVWTANCNCSGTLQEEDCLGVIGGTAQPGTACDDGDALTGNDAFNAFCECVGEVIDCNGVAGGPAIPGNACNDNDPCTFNDAWSTNCECAGTDIVLGSVQGPDAIDGNTTNTYSVPSLPGVTGYSWSLPVGWVSADTTAFALEVTAPNVSGTFELCATALVGNCEVVNCLDVTVQEVTGINDLNGSTANWFSVQPNPSNGIFQLRPNGSDVSSVNVRIYDALGHEVRNADTIASQRSIPLDLSDMAPGAYYLMATRDGQRQMIKLILQR